METEIYNQKIAEEFIYVLRNNNIFSNNVE